MAEMTAEVKAVLDRARRDAPDLRAAGASPAQLRASRKTPAWMRLPMRVLAKVEDRVIPGRGGPIRIRVCTPKAKGPRPVALFFHTGGFVFGDLDSDDPQCRRIADESGCIMVSVDYRLAPENKFPAAWEDAIAAWEWVSAHANEIGGDGVRFAVCGGSAGGNLAAGVCRHARDSAGPKVAFQLIFVGAFNAYPPVPSHALHEEGGTAAYSGMLRTAYRNSEADRDDVRYAPLVSDDFKDFPPAMIVVADCDAFRDEGKLYAAKLRAAGVPVELHVAEGQIHQVFSWAGAFNHGPRVIDRGAAALRKAMKDIRVSVAPAKAGAQRR